jgi:hypothetical protein
LRALTTLFLNDNQIGDAGMIEFSRSITNGSLRALTRLYLDDNQTGDAGMTDFSRAIASDPLLIAAENATMPKSPIWLPSR